jgi:hypothetical protein
MSHVVAVTTAIKPTGIVTQATVFSKSRRVWISSAVRSAQGDVLPQRLSTVLLSCIANIPDTLPISSTVAPTPPTNQAVEWFLEASALWTGA